MKKSPLLVLTTTAFLSAVSSLQATAIYGIDGNNTLLRFDSATPSTFVAVGSILANGNALSIVDLDFYPVNRSLYGFTNNGTGYRINLVNAAATLAITTIGGFKGVVTDADFDPAQDRVRLFTTKGVGNYRLVPDVFTNNAAPIGQIVSDGLFTNAAAVLVGSAYSNNVDGTPTTTLYSIDTTSDSLMIHSGSSDLNTVTKVGSGLGVTVGSNVGFDIGQDGVAYMSDDNNFYTVDLTTGVASLVGVVPIANGSLVSIAAQIVPEPGTIPLGLAGIASLIARRQRAPR